MTTSTCAHKVANVWVALLIFSTSLCSKKIINKLRRSQKLTSPWKPLHKKTQPTPTVSLYQLDLFFLSECLGLWWHRPGHSLGKKRSTLIERNRRSWLGLFMQQFSWASRFLGASTFVNNLFLNTVNNREKWAYFMMWDHWQKYVNLRVLWCEPSGRNRYLKMICCIFWVSMNSNISVLWLTSQNSWIQVFLH